MDLIDKISDLAARISRQKDMVMTEEYSGPLSQDSIKPGLRG